jgi:hypothetical protein
LVLAYDDSDIESVTLQSQGNVEPEAPPVAGVECNPAHKSQARVMSFLELKIKSKMNYNSLFPN